MQPKKQPVKPFTPAQPSIPVAAPTPKDPEEEARKDRAKRLEEMIRKGRQEALRPFWQKYSGEFTDPATAIGTSPLGIAASAGQEDVLRFLLEEARLDPTLSVSKSDTRKPYDLATSKGARNVFRRVRHEHEDWHDWAAAHVSVGLSEEAEAAQDAKKTERRKGLRDKMKEREKARAAAAAEVEEAEPAPAPTTTAAPSSVLGSVGLGPQKLGGKGAEGSLAGLTPEMRMKIERERRARAAEARFAKG